MKTDTKTARKIGALYFDENTILEVKQLGGGGAGVGGANGLNARNLVTGEDTGETIAAQAEQIAEQGEQIETLTAQNTELQAENTQLTEQLADAAAIHGFVLTSMPSSIANLELFCFGPNGNTIDMQLVKQNTVQGSRLGALRGVNKNDAPVITIHRNTAGVALNIAFKNFTGFINASAFNVTIAANELTKTVTLPKLNFNTNALSKFTIEVTSA